MPREMIDYSKVIGDNGHYMTQALFYEFRFQTKNEKPIYNLKERDYKGTLSMYQIYMDSDSEYEAALKILNSWKHWEILCDRNWFLPHIEKWREERDIREAALGKATLIDQARDGNVTAAKALYDQSGKRKAGRPSKDEVEGHKKKQADIDSKVSNILDRMAKHDG
jgi:hypothetical protein